MTKMKDYHRITSQAGQWPKGRPELHQSAISILRFFGDFIAFPKAHPDGRAPF
jgi:hypothetical protein